MIIISSKFYAVKKGYKTGIFDSWEECKKQVDGYPNAIYKSFKSLKEAKLFLSPVGSSTKKSIINTNTKSSKSGTHLIAYVDGSYSSDINRYSFGCILIHSDSIIKELCGSDNDREYIKMRNVSGELLGTQRAIEWAINNNYTSINVHYDYSGIEKWATGEWKTNKLGTKRYSEFIETASKSIEILFTKVEAHSGNYYNEMADKLAKKSLNTNDSLIQNQTPLHIDLTPDNLEFINVDYNDTKLLFTKILATKSKSKTQVLFKLKQYELSEAKIISFIKAYLDSINISKDLIKTIQVNVDLVESSINSQVSLSDDKILKYKFNI